MTGPVAKRLSGDRLHLQHGPIDLIIGADGDRETAFDAALAKLETVLADLVDELPLLRKPTDHRKPSGETARRMHDASSRFSGQFITPMAAVAGAVADTVLGAMKAATPLRRAYVNNGGDIALHVQRDERFALAMAAHDGRPLGKIEITGTSKVRGIATSGRHGRSLSLGIADSVTVLARTAAQADAAATLIANAVDLADHPAIRRLPANQVRDDSDLGSRMVVTHVGSLSKADTNSALLNGFRHAQEFLDKGLIFGASLHLNGETRTLNMPIGALENA